MTRDEMLARNAAGGLDCPRGCVPDEATYEACVDSLIADTDEYPVPVCERCHGTLEFAADDRELTLARGPMGGVA